MPEIVKNIAEQNGESCMVTLSVSGGVSLKDHWEGNSGLQTKTLIEKERFDFVVLQDQSLAPIIEAEKTLSYGKKLADLAIQQGAQIIIYQTWARKNNPDSQSKLDATFEKLALNTGAKIAPVAKAWHLTKRDFPVIELYDPDGSHPSELGSFLTALIFYKTIYKKSAIGSDFLPDPVHPNYELIQLLMNIASQVR
ncbi:MAG: hypothetical protein ABJF11_09915 [Reichenbachiella sp.]|uniref:hypothetical protein n=1 Tax=Reichenbachiella sp. TaxID=2184521 RepID=UPI003265C61D